MASKDIELMDDDFVGEDAARRKAGLRKLVAEIQKLDPDEVEAIVLAARVKSRPNEALLTVGGEGREVAALMAGLTKQVVDKIPLDQMLAATMAAHGIDPDEALADALEAKLEAAAQPN